jgi:hypothetical protein
MPMTPTTATLVGFRIFVRGRETMPCYTADEEEAQREALRRRVGASDRVYIESLYHSSLVPVRSCYYDNDEDVWVDGPPPKRVA